MATKYTDLSADTPPMFTPFRLRELTLSNRVVMSPMCMYSADDLDGTPTDFHVVHLGSRAVGGAALVFTEMTQISREARISPGDAGIYDDKHIEPWKRVVDFVHARSDAKIGMQLGHAGRKACEPIAWLRDTPLTEEEKWEIVAPSAVPFGPDSEMPKEMNQGDIAKVIDDFVSGAERANKAGFDIIELHRLEIGAEFFIGVVPEDDPIFIKLFEQAFFDLFVHFAWEKCFLLGRFIHKVWSILFTCLLP